VIVGITSGKRDKTPHQVAHDFAPEELFEFLKAPKVTDDLEASDSVRDLVRRYSEAWLKASPRETGL
jgi:hypothetical protein